MTTNKLQAQIASEVKAIKDYAERYKCGLAEAAYDILTDEPCTRSLAHAVIEALGLYDVPEDRYSKMLFAYRWQSITEVNDYYREYYDN